MNTNDPKALLKSKHKADKQKEQFTQFTRHVIGETTHELGQDIIDQARIPDQQNKMKSVENRQLE